jgi:hypothetical protein
MFPISQEGCSSNDTVQQHLGLFSLPAGDQVPTLAEFGQQLQQLVSAQGSPGQQHFRLEYKW